MGLYNRIGASTVPPGWFEKVGVLFGNYTGFCFQSSNIHYVHVTSSALFKCT